MKSIHTLALLAAFLFALAASHAESVKLSVNDAFGLNQALAQLDAGVTHVIKAPAAAEGADQAPDKIVTTAYDFSPATRLAIYRNRRELEAQIGDFEKSRLGIIKTIWGERAPDLEAERKRGSAEWLRYVADVTKLGTETVKVELTKLNAEDLYRAGNPIPSSLMLQLGLLLSEKK